MRHVLLGLAFLCALPSVRAQEDEKKEEVAKIERRIAELSGELIGLLKRRTELQGLPVPDEHFREAVRDFEEAIRLSPRFRPEEFRRPIRPDEGRGEERREEAARLEAEIAELEEKLQGVPQDGELAESLRKQLHLKRAELDFLKQVPPDPPSRRERRPEFPDRREGRRGVPEHEQRMQDLHREDMELLMQEDNWGMHLRTLKEELSRLQSEAVRDLSEEERKNLKMKMDASALKIQESETAYRRASERRRAIQDEMKMLQSRREEMRDEAMARVAQLEKEVAELRAREHAEGATEEDRQRCEREAERLEEELARIRRPHGDRRSPDPPARNEDAERSAGEVKEFLKEFEPDLLLRLEDLREAGRMEEYHRILREAAPRMHQLSEMQRRDPEAFERHRIARELERRAMDLARQAREGEGDREELKKVLGDLFELHLNNRAAELQQLAKRLEEVRRDLKETAKRKTEEIEKRVDELLRRKDRGASPREALAQKQHQLEETRRRLESEENEDEKRHLENRARELEMEVKLLSEQLEEFRGSDRR